MGCHMAHAKRCDRCQAFYVANKCCGSEDFVELMRFGRYLTTPALADLCPECYQSLQAWWRRAPSPED